MLYDKQSKKVDHLINYNIWDKVADDTFFTISDEVFSQVETALNEVHDKSIEGKTWNEVEREIGKNFFQKTLDK